MGYENVNFTLNLNSKEKGIISILSCHGVKYRKSPSEVYRIKVSIKFYAPFLPFFLFIPSFTIGFLGTEEKISTSIRNY